MKILKELIAIESVSGNENVIQTYIYTMLKSMGGKPRILDGNVVMKIAGKHPSAACILNAHVDTVAAGNTLLWSHDPFEGFLENGKLYGLGASDEKATIASFLMLANQFCNTPPACDVFFTFVTKEETNGTGTSTVMKWFAATQQHLYKNVAGILGEPTGLAECEIAHKGNIFLRVMTHGDSGHGSNPTAIKTHAVMVMMQVMQKIQQRGEQWKELYSDNVLGSPSIGLLTSIQAGDEHSPNKFPDSCIATFDIRTTPKLHHAAIDEIKNLCPEAHIDTQYAPIACGYTDASEQIVQALKEVTAVPVLSSLWSNDMCFFTEYGIPAIVFGPGEKETIHKPDEYCYVENIEMAKMLYEKIINNWVKRI